MSVKQDWYDQNRRLFGADTSISPVAVDKCQHTRLKRVSASEVQCACGAGWIDNGRWTIDNGRAQ